MIDILINIIKLLIHLF